MENADFIKETNEKIKNNNDIKITLYKEDYSNYGWKIICKSLQIEDDSIIDNLNCITIEVSSITGVYFKK